MSATVQKQAPLKLRPWEVLLLALFSGVFALSLYLYTTDFPIIRRYVFGLEETGSSRPAGVLRGASGKVRRKKSNQSAFETVGAGDPVYYLDTLVTGPGVEAEIQLADGGQISLAQSTMVKLTFDSQLSLAGVSRQTNLELIQGSVSGEAKGQNLVVKTTTGKATSLKGLGRQKIEQVIAAPQKPVIAAPVPLASPVAPPPVIAKIIPQPVIAPPPPPPPPPVEPKAPALSASPLLPAKGSIWSLPPGTSSTLLDVNLAWRTNLPSGKVEVQLFRIDRGGEAVSLFSNQVESQNGDAGQRVRIERPGLYEWRLLPAVSRRGRDKSTPLASSQFRVAPEFDGIELLKPLVAGAEIQSNQAQGQLLKDFGGVTLRWRPLAGAKKYKVKIYKGDQELTPALEKELDEAQYTFNRNKVILGRFVYRVYALLASGFVARSKADGFTFEFLPPRLVQPLNGATVQGTTQGGKPAPRSVLFTWQKTHFTDAYELEIATDEGFSRALIKKRVRENFQAIPMPEPGSYYWRVRSVSQSTLSPPSPPNTLIISR